MKLGPRYKAKVQTPYGPRRCFEANLQRQGSGRKPLVARFGGIPLKRQKTVVLTDRQPSWAHPRKELITRLLGGRCELCEATDTIQVHHVRKLADLTASRPQPAWAMLMAKRRRKTLVVCQACHESLHAGQPAARTE